jgi:DNA-binding GntR family transcriptional regulator
VSRPSRARPLLVDVVRAALRAAILSGEFPMGAQLPNEEQLCVRFNVSRVTIREAIRGLIEDGYVVRRQGAGTFVTRRPQLRNSLDQNFSYTAYLEASGARAGRQILSIRAMAADEETSSALGLELDASVVQLRRVRTADRRPAVYSVDYLPADLADAEKDRDGLGGSLYRLLTVRLHAVDHGEAVLAPATADREMSRHLAVPAGSLLQYMKQVDYDVEGRPVLLSHEWHVPSVIELHVYRRGPGPVESAGPSR